MPINMSQQAISCNRRCSQCLSVYCTERKMLIEPADIVNSHILQSDVYKHLVKK